MLATTGFENKHQLRIYENEVIVNLSEIKMLEQLNDSSVQIPEPVTKIIPYIDAKLPMARSGYNGPLTDKHKSQFPKTYEAFKNKQDRVEDVGTPLTEMPEMSTGVRERLEAMGIKTIESLADIDDITAARLPKGIKLRERAKSILKMLKDDYVNKSQVQMSALELKLAELVDVIGDQQEMVAAQQETIAALTAKVNKKAPPKKETVTIEAE